MSKLRLGASHTCTQRTHARSAHMHAAHTCTQRTHARSAHMHAAHTCTRTRALNVTLRVHVSAPFGCGLTSRGAKRTVRYEKEKTNRAMRMHLRCIRLNLTSFGPLHGPLRLRSAPLPGCGLPSVEKKKKKVASWRRVPPASHE